MEEKTEENRSLLIIDDDQVFASRLGRAMERHEFNVTIARSLEDGKRFMFKVNPSFALIDLKLEDGCGLDLIKPILRHYPKCRIAILSGYSNIATAITAIKAGAVNYLEKPAGPEEVIQALLDRGKKAEVSDSPMSANRVRWEHIQRVYEQCDRNVSGTARVLKMHRRSLQRILSKRSPV